MADEKKPQGNRMPAPGTPVASKDSIAALATPQHVPDFGEAPRMPNEGIPQSELADELQDLKDEEAKHELQRVGDSATDMKVAVKTGGIDVVAVRDGYIYNIRRAPDDRFRIHSMEEWGDWMRLADEKAEAARVREVRSKRQQAEKKALEARGQ